ncbi:uncharacterized protein Bfra_011674 [Botrytis fragariae]|uniref:Ribosomal protein L33 n=1 Tax=Botrytis fragariae TaxID=1964551 RepID=A0A8H6EEE7_9HELO|nr:uncharacterized protein Bfra_011674 [Botrytis fragariae]KAF5869131.1 hypothetical protein Bfra_011674 [Botrytis fragariae]
MALTGYYKTLIRPRAHRPLSMLKYDPVGWGFWDWGCSGGGRGEGMRREDAHRGCEIESEENAIEDPRTGIPTYD